jgi:hypothetical protein
MFKEVAGDFSAFNAGLPIENRLEEIRAIPHRSIDVTLEKRVWTRMPVELDPYFTGFSEELHLSSERVLLWPSRMPPMTRMLTAHERITDSGIMDTGNQFVITTVPEQWGEVSLLIYNLMSEDVSFQEFFSDAFNWFFYVLPLSGLPNERETCRCPNYWASVSYYASRGDYARCLEMIPLFNRAEGLPPSDLNGGPYRFAPEHREWLFHSDRR